MCTGHDSLLCLPLYLFQFSAPISFHFLFFWLWLECLMSSWFRACITSQGLQLGRHRESERKQSQSKQQSCPCFICFLIWQSIWLYTYDAVSSHCLSRHIKTGPNQTFGSISVFSKQCLQWPQFNSSATWHVTQGQKGIQEVTASHHSIANAEETSWGGCCGAAQHSSTLLPTWPKLNHFSETWLWKVPPSLLIRTPLLLMVWTNQKEIPLMTNVVGITP